MNDLNNDCNMQINIYKVGDRWLWSVEGKYVNIASRLNKGFKTYSLALANWTAFSEKHHIKAYFNIG